MNPIEQLEKVIQSHQERAEKLMRKHHDGNDWDSDEAFDDYTTITTELAELKDLLQAIK